ncbi:PfkB family carbohydrate kinase [Chloroflexota bacterium]
MSILVVGSVAIDSVETPFGRASGILGGSAIYFAGVASLYTKVNLVAVVGTDFPTEQLQFLTNRGVDTKGLQVKDGETFCWAGRYNYETNTCENLDTQLNVFADFHPVLPEGYEQSDVVFLANIDPDLQFEVLSQVPKAKLTMLDTRDFWIREKREALTAVISAVNVVTMNEGEAHIFAGTYSTLTAAKAILALGPKIVIIKQGEYGCTMVGEDGYFSIPACPIEDVKDPTGAGDTFAGGFLGYLDKIGEMTPQLIRRAIVHGCATASFAVEEFGVDRLRSLTVKEIARRYQDLHLSTQFENG